MDVDLFDFELPSDRIATRPAHPRDSARLLCVTGRSLADHRVRDLPDLLVPGDLLVVNDTRVQPVLLSGTLANRSVEVLLHRRTGPGCWRALCRPLRALREGDLVRFGNDLSARVVHRNSRDAVLDFRCSDQVLADRLAVDGFMPLPPYIRKRRQPDVRDREDYQTLFARTDGSIAAPTAGLHFTPDLLDRLRETGIDWISVTLHVGAATFLPVRSADARDHPMQSEWGNIDPEASSRIRTARQRGGRVIAVGTTVLRLLESASAPNGEVNTFRGETDLFILPGQAIRSADLLLTNFHLPRSTLFMLVSAFSGRERMLEAYAHAIREQYRFYSYGDATLLERAGSA